MQNIKLTLNSKVRCRIKSVILIKIAPNDVSAPQTLI
jgi:hypothetical protein